MLQLPEIQSLQTLSRDGRLLFATRMIRMFAYGSIAIVLGLYLAQVGLSDTQIGLVLSLTLLGDAAISLPITIIADRLGRRRMLIAGSGLMIFAGVVFALTSNITLLIITAIIGTISPSGNEVGPFLAVEQAALPQTTTDKQRTQVFAWYSLLGSIMTGLGSLTAGLVAQTLQNAGQAPLVSYRVVIVGYALLGAVLGVMFTRLSPAVEIQSAQGPVTLQSLFGLKRSRGIVTHLSLLFMIDAFAGGLVVQSLVALWFNRRFGVDPAVIGAIYFGANFFAGLSALAAARVAARYGLVNTMVFSHVPSNILLILVPLMPTLPLAILVLLARFSISQMDVPTRQSYTVAVVDPDERSAANGITNLARTTAAALSPAATGALFSAGGIWISAPFILAGGMKLVYDFLLYRSFVTVKPPEEIKS
ncbi:MAG TPA: MFS transporter [Aggregatilineales bacterium]|nr:MFS transporter [Aggregatilineales bacterium]